MDEVWATNCKFFQPRVAATESDGAYAELTYRVPSPFQVMLYRVCPTAPDRLDAILLAVHPVDEHLCRAQPVEYLVDDHSADNDLLSFEQAIFLQDRFIVENQRPLSLPLRPGAGNPGPRRRRLDGLPALAARQAPHVRRSALSRVPRGLA